MYKYNTSLPHARIIKSTGEELVMSTVNRVTALECNNILILRKGSTDLSRGLAWEITNRCVKSSYLSSHVVLTTLGCNHEGSRVLNFGGSVTFEALKGLVGDEFIGELNSSNGVLSVLEENLHTRLKIFGIGIEYNGKSENKSIRKLHRLYNRFVRLFVHESSKGGESSVTDKLNITKLTGGKLKLSGTFSNSCALSIVVLKNEINKSSSMGNLLGHLKSTATHKSWD